MEGLLDANFPPVLNLIILKQKREVKFSIKKDGRGNEQRVVDSVWENRKWKRKNSRGRGGCSKK